MAEISAFALGRHLLYAVASHLGRVEPENADWWVESDHGNFGMYRLRPQQKGPRLLYTLDPTDRIGETDPIYAALPAKG